MLQIVDAQWKDHLYSLDHLKEGIGLRGYGQRDPLVEYKKESFALFQSMKDRIEEEIVRYLWRLTPVMGDDPNAAAPVRQPPPRRAPQMTHAARQQAPPPSPFGAIARRCDGAYPTRLGPRARAATIRSGRSSATSRRSGETTRVPAAAGRNTRSVMEHDTGSGCEARGRAARSENAKSTQRDSRNAVPLCLLRTAWNTHGRSEHRSDLGRPLDRVDL